MFKKILSFILVILCLIPVISVAEEKSFLDDYIYMTQSKITIGVGQIVGMPLRSSFPYEWLHSKVSKKKIVEYDEFLIYGVKKGETKITFTAPNGEKASIKVKVLAAPKKLKLSKTNVKYEVGSNFKIKCDYNHDLEWYSDHPKIARVKNGEVFCLRPGYTTITAVAYNGAYAECEVFVYEEPQDFWIDEFYTVKKGKTITIKPEFEEYEYSDYKLSSSNKKIATVSGHKVKGKKRGFSTITVKLTNGIRKKCIVEVV